MKSLGMLALAVLLLTGCTTPQRYVVDIEKIDRCAGFDWDGKVTVTMSWKGLFGGGTTVDLIKLRSRDGRSLLLETTGGRVAAYVEVEVERAKNTGEPPAK